MYGTSNQFLVLRERKPPDQSSGQVFQSSVRNDRDFSTVSTQDGQNSDFSLLAATADSYPSFDNSEFLALPQSPSHSPFQELQFPGPQLAAQSPSSTTFSSASPSSSIDLHPVHCGQCQMIFDDVEPTLKHIAVRHRGPGSPVWPCVLSNCGKCFEYEKDLRRHLGTQHFDKLYVCSCDPRRRRRRDKHRGHINRDHVKGKQALGSGLLVCQCGHTISGKEPRALERHLQHIEKECREWQPRKRGRPPKSDKKSA